MNKIFSNEINKINQILGEPIRVSEIVSVSNDITNIFDTYGSFKPSTRATYNFEARTYSIEGTINETETNKIKPGQYFFRLNEKAGSYFFIESINTEPTSNNIVYAYCFECNVVVNIARQRTDINGGKIVDKNGNHIEVWRYIIKQVPAYLVVATRSLKPQNDGSLDQTIYNLHIPSIIDIQEYDRITINYKDGTEGNYRVDSVSKSLKGVYILQLTFDIRGGVYAEEK